MNNERNKFEKFSDCHYSYFTFIRIQLRKSK